VCAVSIEVTQPEWKAATQVLLRRPSLRSSDYKLPNRQRCRHAGRLDPEDIYEAVPIPPPDFCSIELTTDFSSDTTVPVTAKQPIS